LELRAIPLVVLVQQTLDEKKSKHASLVQENGFGLALLRSVLWLGNGTAKPSTWCHIGVRKISIKT
jgi:hypothetical protein